MDFKKIYEKSVLREGKRDIKIMSQFKEGFKALDEAFATIPSVKKAITEFRFRLGEDDFNGEYIIEIAFNEDVIDIWNVYWYLVGAKDRVKMTPKWSKEKAAAEIINDSLEYDDVYIMDSPAGEVLYIINATPTGKVFD